VAAAACELVAEVEAEASEQPEARPAVVGQPGELVPQWSVLVGSGLEPLVWWSLASAWIRQASTTW
jgi:hypothetical protein